MRLLTAIAIALMSLAPLCHARTLLIYAGTPRGGSGDVASNWIIANQLRLLLPNDRIIFAVDETIHERMIERGVTSEPVAGIMARFIPGYRPGRSITVNGIDIGTFQRHELPYADYGIATSMRTSDHSHLKLVTHANISLVFSELSSRHLLSRHSLTEGTERAPCNADGVCKGIYADSLGVYHSEWGKVAILESGPYTRGMYTLPFLPNPPLDRLALEKALLKHLGLGLKQRGLIWSGWRPNPLAGKLLGFSYSFHGGPTQKYINVVKAAAASDLYKHERLAIFVRDFADLQVEDLPPNLEVHRYKSMEFSVLESLIAHAGIAIQISGHISLSQAIQYGKVCFMDNASPGHIAGGPRAFFERVKEVDSYFQAEPYSRLFSMAAVMQSYDLSTAEQLRFGPSPELLLAIMTDTTYHQKFKAALDVLRPQMSLPQTIVEYIELLDRQPANASMVDLAKVLDIRDGRTTSDVIPDVIGEARASCEAFMSAAAKKYSVRP